MDTVGQFPEKFDISVSVASGVESVLKKEISPISRALKEKNNMEL